ncbi:MAG: FKBP-type peptidyl-prolyl cis-trans isomerase [Candidatus Micrarchaeia archaeon]
MVKTGKGDLVRLELTGRLVSDNSAFESTDEKVAKDSGIWSDASKYGPRLVIVGRGAMIAGLEEAMQKLQLGKNEQIFIPADKAFGKRHNELVRVMPQKEFEKHGIQAIAGLMVTIDGVPALVKTVSSGRIMLDFNHPLAGQDLKYDIKLIDVISEPEKKAHELATQFEAKIEIKENGAKKKIIIAAKTEQTKARGLEAALRASLGDWATIEIAN